MVLRKQNLLTPALEATVAFEILCALNETMVPLLEKVLKIVFWNTWQ
jgi:hypothetical protein